jgi:alkaline phosphatase
MIRSILLALLIAVASCGPAPETAPPSMPAPVGMAADAAPSGVILLIGDGTGLTYWSALKLYSEEPLAIEEFPVVGLVDTEALGSKITDSAASGTAFAAGVRTYNGAIAVDADSAAVTTVLEIAEGRDWATGLVSTSRITHATPAAFVAHVPSRHMYAEIAAQMANSGVDVLLGGGTSFFDPAVREDGRDLIRILEGKGAYVSSTAAFRALDMDTVRALYGLFGERDMPAAPSRQPSLPELTDAALTVLAKDPDGFFLMAEASQIDWRGHDNAPLPALLAEVQDFDRTVRRALAFQERRPNTLILVVADHSTGGLSLAADSLGVLDAFYTTEGHTAEMVPLFARGPGAEAFGGVMDNDRVGRLLLQLVGSEEVGMEPASK